MGTHIVLSHASALQYWRFAAAGLAPMPRRCRVADLSQATSSLRDIPTGDLAWRTIDPKTLTSHGIVPRAAVEPGLALLAQRGGIPTMDVLMQSLAQDPSLQLTNKEEVRKAVLRRLVGMSWRALDGAATVDSATGAPPTGAPFNESDKPRMDYVFSQPIDVLVGSLTNRRASSSVRPHCWSRELPPGALWRINDSVLIVSPSLLLVQLAGCHTGSPHIIAAAGLELAGTYSLLPRGYVDCSNLIDEGREITDANGRLLGDGYSRARQVLVPEDLKKTIAFVSALAYCRGIDACRAAARCIVAGSSTPFETGVDVSLALVRWHGGFCAGVPELNKAVTLSPEARALYNGRRSCAPDALFIGRRGNKVDVEPGGDLWHSGAWKKDNSRRQALEHDGYVVVAVSWDEFVDFARWSMLAESVARSLGRCTRQPSERTRERQARVHADLVDLDVLRDAFG